MGRHHRPSQTGRRIATVTAATAITAGGGAAFASAASAAVPTGVLDEIEKCESGGDATAQNPNSTASGAFQFLDSTWQSVTGLSGSASDHSYATQRAAAEKLLAQQGTTPWNASKGCWGGKSGAVSPNTRSAAEPRHHAAEKPAVKKTAPKVKAKSIETYQALPPVTPKAAKAAPGPSVPAAARFTPGGSGTYTVRAGDTLSSLALEHGTTVERLMDRNSDILEMPDWIFVGEKIHLR